MIIQPLNQLNPEWKNVRIGRSATTIGKDGCVIVSLCMMLQKLREYAAYPPDAARYWKFNLKGEILWERTGWKGAKYITRGYYPDYAKIAEYANVPQLGVIMEVNHSKHWVYVEKVVGETVEIIDPIDGMRYDKLPSKYTFTGYALFESVPVPIPEWLVPLWDKAKAKGLKATSPATELTMETLLDAMFEMKLIDKPKGEINVGEFIASLDKVSGRW